MVRMLKRLIAYAIDAVLPPKARTARLSVLSLENIPLEPATHELLGVRITTLANYERPETRDLIRSLKYDANAKAARLCAGLLAEFLREELADEALFSHKRIVLSPVPLHASRERERGYNQVIRVLEMLPPELRDGTKASFAPRILERVRATKAQTRLPRAERLNNVASAFRVIDNDLARGARVYLFDDVATTGATLANAGNALRRAGAEVSLIALARA